MCWFSGNTQIIRLHWGIAAVGIETTHLNTRAPIQLGHVKENRWKLHSCNWVKKIGWSAHTTSLELASIFFQNTPKPWCNPETPCELTIPVTSHCAWGAAWEMARSGPGCGFPMIGVVRACLHLDGTFLDSRIMKRFDFNIVNHVYQFQVSSDQS